MPGLAYTLIFNSRIWCSCLLIVLVGSILISCSGVGGTQTAHEYSDLSQDSLSRSKSLPSPKGSYFDVAWLDNDSFAFLYQERPGNDIRTYQLYVFTMSTNSWHLAEIPRPANCGLDSIFLPQRLPNARLGFMHQCNIVRSAPRQLHRMSVVQLSIAVERVS